MKILGLSAFYHDSAASIVVNGKIIAAVQEERFTREKHTADFPVQAIKYCLEESGLILDELDAVVFYDKPFLKFERLLETYYAFAPKGLISFLKAIPIWVKEKIFLKKMIYDGLKEAGDYNKKKLKLLFTEHHLSHAASAFFPSPFEKAAILTIDGVGEWSTASIGIGSQNQLTVKKEMHFPHSVGLLYSAFTYYLGFKVNSGEYKVMGLAPYGNPQADQTKHFIEIIKSDLVDIKKDGSIWVNQKYFGYSTGLKMIKEKEWLKLFGLRKRDAETNLTQDYCNMAYAIQKVTEDIVIGMVKEAKRITKADRLCLAGGVALNCVSNTRILNERIFEQVFFQPAAGDAGGALGAALSAQYLYFEKKRMLSKKSDEMLGTYLGPEYSEKEITLMNRKVKAVCDKLETDDLMLQAASEIANGKILGWFQGRMEFGPRALGNRSILADARDPEMQKKINLKIKFREGFRPFAPSVLNEEKSKYFDLDVASPYMTITALVKENRRKVIGEHWGLSSIEAMLKVERSDIQAVTHVDFSARVQTVDKEMNPRYWKLINAFKELTGYGLIINTSFNVRGEPIVCTPMDAYRCFMYTDMDFLVINNFIYDKRKQPNWESKRKWKFDFELD